MEGRGVVLGFLGVLLLALQGLAQEAAVLNPGADGVQHGQMVLDSYSYMPHTLIVQAGIPIELTLHSRTFLTPHNFIITEPAAGLSVSQDVPAGDTTTVRFTVPKPGRYAFYCDKKLLFFKSHREKGMEGWLEAR